MSTAVHSRPGPPSKTARRRAERLIVDHLPQLAARAVELALLGDPQCLATCLNIAWAAGKTQSDKQEVPSA